MVAQNGRKNWGRGPFGFNEGGVKPSVSSGTGGSSGFSPEIFGGGGGGGGGSSSSGLLPTTFMGVG